MNRKRSRGFVLVTSLIFLIVLSVLGVMAMRGSLFEQRMAANDRDMNMAREFAEMALRWCLDFEAVGVLIPGAKNPDQVRANVRASELPPLSPALHAQLAEFYQKHVASHIRGPY